MGFQKSTTYIYIYNIYIWQIYQDHMVYSLSFLNDLETRLDSAKLVRGRNGTFVETGESPVTELLGLV